MQELKNQLQSRTTSIKNAFGRPAAIVAAVIGILLAVTLFQQSCDRRAINEQTEQIKEYERQTRETREQTARLMEMFDRQHQSTVVVLDAMKEMSGTISNLMENDRAFESEVKHLKQNYDEAKNPNQPNKTNNPVRAARRNLPIDRRESDALADDERLYGKSGTN